MSGDQPRILIVKLSSIGDVVQSLPVANALRRRFPRAYLAWAVGPAAADVVTDNPNLDDVLVIGANSESTSRLALPSLHAPRRLRATLRSFHFTITLDLQGLFKSAAVAYLTGAAKRIGYQSRRELTNLFNNFPIIPIRPDLHAVDLYLQFATALEADATPVEFPLAVSDVDQRRVDELLGPSGDFAALIPGARWESKLWPSDHFAVVADALYREFGLTSLVIGGPTDNQLATAISSSTNYPVLNMTGCTTLKQTAEIFRRCRLTIGNDTGPLYLSSAVGTPTIALFGPSDAKRLGPYGEGHAKLVADVDCAPCRNRVCTRRRCLESIHPDQVLEAARQLITSPAQETFHG